MLTEKEHHEQWLNLKQGAIRHEGTYQDTVYNAKLRERARAYCKQHKLDIPDWCAYRYRNKPYQSALDTEIRMRLERIEKLLNDALASDRQIRDNNGIRRNI